MLEKESNSKDELTVLDAFRDLVSQKGWRKLLVNPKMAEYYALKLKKGEAVGADSIRCFIEEAGYKLIQVEKWKRDNNLIK